MKHLLAEWRGRRAHRTRLAVPAIALAVSLACRVAAEPALVETVGPVGFTVSDLDRSIAFFTDVLTFEEASKRELHGEELERLSGVFGSRARVARLALGEETIELTEYLAPRGNPYPADTRSNDLWFQHVAIVVNDMDAAYQRLRDHDVEHASPAPQRLPDWNPNAGGIRAFYFRDPDGHFLEILSFPPGKGDPRWHKRTEKLFLGIDHTAIVVSDTDESLAFYRDVLGLKVAGESENYGIEQERLNNVFGARLRITTLRAAKGPGIEFLEYLTPSGGRPAPLNLHANDLAHWQTHLAVDPRRELEPPSGAFSRVSARPVEDPSESLGFEAGFLVRDPDGHGLLLTRPSERSET
jgi:catechol 2,3-dioxygenase-like lactoylglutathione lyase family enzyme